ncbi:CHASE domain-containing protein [Luteimonas sp. SDU82]|uniref:CHASE domain-containing protein n=1 Tax=Luteimonas sp. SDU82 TaxID=3422592 RepID=UPI003EBD8A8B
MSQVLPGAVGAAGRSRPRVRRGYVLAVLTLIGSLLIVWHYAGLAGERERMALHARFVSDSNEITTQLRQRLLHYELALRGGVSLYWSVARPTQRQWRDYVGGLDIEHQFKGMMGLGYVPYLRRSDLDALQLAMRDEGKGLFQIRPHGVREIYGPILLLEPQTLPNRDAIGFDMFSEAGRHRAMAAARDSGEVRLSAPLALLQDRDGRQDDLLMFAPVYANGIQPGNLLARRNAISGWVYAPFNARAFVDSALEPYRNGQLIRILDLGDDVGGERLLHQDADYIAHAGAEAGPLQHSTTFEAYGRQWRIDFQPRAQAGTGRGLSDREAVLAAGAALSLLLFAVVLALAHTQSRAERLAEAMSESYRRSEQRLRNAMLYSGTGIALLDGEGRIVEANPALSRILGVALGALPGTRFSAQFLDPEAETALADSATAPATLQLRRSDGDIRLVQAVLSPVPGDIGSDVAMLVQVDDATDRLRAERAVRLLNRTLEARVEQRTHELTLANRELESFAYSVSHDLRAPLRTVEGFSRLLGERFAPEMGPEALDYLARVRNAANRMDALIDALLKMSRITREPLRHARVDMSRLATEVMADLRQAEPSRQVEVEIEPGLVAGGDPALLRNLLQNLLGNAWKFSAGRSPARIRLAADAGAADLPEGMAGFVVCDNGAGFDPAYASKLFRPFQRLHGADEYEGHGIGLATVKRIVERHGGSIQAEGRSGEGATFRFTLPAEPVEPHEPRQPQD